METTETKEEKAVMLCRILTMPVRRWLFILALFLLFLARYVVAFARETGSPRCDLQSGLTAVLNLSQHQCEELRRVTNRSHDDTASIRNKIVEKRLEVKGLSRVSKAEPDVIGKKVEELRALEQDLSRRDRQTELDQQKLLTSEQLNKMKSTASSSNVLPSGERKYETQQDPPFFPSR